MVLEPLEILNGLLSFILVAQSIYVGILIASKYSKYKNKYLILLGIDTILLFEPWWPSTVSFLMIFIIGKGLTLQMYLLLGNILIPVSVLIWLIFITHFMYQRYRKVILIIYSSLSVIYNVFFLYFFFTDPELIGQLQGAVDINYSNFLLGYLLVALVVLLITGILFAKTLLKSENPEIKLKGKLILIGFISFVLGAILDSAIPLNPITLPITRIILMISAFELYGGFILPDWMKKLFLKRS
jgi:hypothetical protein